MAFVKFSHTFGSNYLSRHLCMCMLTCTFPPLYEKIEMYKQVKKGLIKRASFLAQDGNKLKLA